MKRYLSREFAFISFHNIHNFFIIITPIFGPTKEDRVGGWLSTQSIPSPTKSVPGFNCSFAGRYTISIITFANISCLFTFYLKTLVITHIYMLSSHFTPDWGTYFVFFVITVCSDIWCYFVKKKRLESLLFCFMLSSLEILFLFFFLFKIRHPIHSMNCSLAQNSSHLL